MTRIEGIKRRYRRATAREDIPFLRAEIDRLTAERDALNTENEQLRAAYTRCMDCEIVCAKEVCKKAWDDRDRYRARAEALERAAQRYIPCKVCIHKDDDCEGCAIWLPGTREERWQFDEARFAGGKEGSTCD